MMYIILTSSLALMTTWIAPRKTIWPIAMCKSLMMSLTSLNLMNKHLSSSWHNLSLKFATDPLSTPLMILSSWLMPMSIIASMNTIQNQKIKNQRTFISLMFMILTALILTFSSLELTLFYMAFESTLLPTLTLMSRWGTQKERFQASMYFLFYTLMGSLPLLMAMMAMNHLIKTTTLPTIPFKNSIKLLPLTNSSIWWICCFIAFTMKMPIYGFHLWLPKAHVEAPMAGSMMLAAILLKLGGYGLIRTTPLFLAPKSYYISLPMTTFCMWGALITSMMCLRQTDLKALMAYSSVGHMSLVAAGMFSLSLWGTKGALILMMAHGLVSSALFSLAKLLYERNTTRTLSITRGFKLMTPLLTIWWTITCMANLGLPPSPNLIGEMLILIAIMDWKTLSTPMMTMTTVFSAIYSLLMLKKTNNKTFPQFLTKMAPLNTSEHTLATFHMLPLMLLITNPSLMSMK